MATAMWDFYRPYVAVPNIKVIAGPIWKAYRLEFIAVYEGAFPLFDCR